MHCSSVAARDSLPGRGSNHGEVTEEGEEVTEEASAMQEEERSCIALEWVAKVSWYSVSLASCSRVTLDSFCSSWSLMSGSWLAICSRDTSSWENSCSCARWLVTSSAARTASCSAPAQWSSCSRCRASRLQWSFSSLFTVILALNQSPPLL